MYPFVEELFALIAVLVFAICPVRVDDLEIVGCRIDGNKCKQVRVHLAQD